MPKSKYEVEEPDGHNIQKGFFKYSYGSLSLVSRQNSKFNIQLIHYYYQEKTTLSTNETTEKKLSYFRLGIFGKMFGINLVE